MLQMRSRQWLTVEMPDALMFLINFVVGETDTPENGTLQIL